MSDALPDLPLEHVARPQPPWRSHLQLTECGLPAAGRLVITRDEFLAKVRRQGKQRSSLTTCITCWQTACRWPSWDESPVRAIMREAAAGGYRGEGERVAAFRDELVAIAELIERHRGEFDTILEGLGETVRLDDRRRQRDRRAR